MMPKRMESKGKCSFCSELFSGSTIIRHLISCESRKQSFAEETVGLNFKRGKVFGLKVQASYNSAYWLCLEAKSTLLLSSLDQFLRDIWLECCGHLSAFTINEESYQSAREVGFGSYQPERGMNTPLAKIFSPELEFHYEYDFGSTTDLDLKVVWEREGRIGKKGISILARNEPFAFKCVSCGSLAELSCTECSYEKEASYCKQCISKHKCGDDMSLPIVNSPRMGVCGYEGSLAAQELNAGDSL